MTEPLVITLAVLVAVFGTTTVLLVIYVILSRCFPHVLRRRPISREAENHRVVGFPRSEHGTQAEGYSNYSVGQYVNMEPVSHPPIQPKPCPRPPPRYTCLPFLEQRVQRGDSSTLLALSTVINPDRSDVHVEAANLDSEEETDDQVPPLRGHSIRPQFSCRYRRQTMDIYVPHQASPHINRGLNLSQLGILSAAQDYYENLKADTIKPNRALVTSIIDPAGLGDIEELIVPDIQEVRVLDLGKAPPGQLASPVIPKEQRPKTYFNAVKGAPAETDTGVDVSHGMFISKSLGANGAGGTLELHGITLEIPAGALTTDETIALGVLWTSDHQPPLSDKQCMLCPVVSCEPHGLKLKKAATLTMPHCAVNVAKHWKLSAWCSDKPTTGKQLWQPFPNDSVKITRRNIELKLNHFTSYTGTGEPDSSSAEKWVELVAFAPPLTGKNFTLRVYCLNNYSDNEARDKKKMLESEKQQKGNQVTSVEPLTFSGDGKNLCLEMDQILEPWRLSSICQMKEEIAFKKVWHAMGASCKFILESGDESPDKVECKLLAYQADHDDREKLLISQERQKTRIDSRLDPETMGKVFPGSLPDILKKMLDPEQPALGNNWAALYERMDLPSRDYVWLVDDHRQGGRSPTLYLLNIWAENKTLVQFEEVMRQIGRYDILDEINTWRSTQS